MVKGFPPVCGRTLGPALSLSETTSQVAWQVLAPELGDSRPSSKKCGANITESSFNMCNYDNFSLKFFMLSDDIKNFFIRAS